MTCQHMVLELVPSWEPSIPGAIATLCWARILLCVGIMFPLMALQLGATFERLRCTALNVANEGCLRFGMYSLGRGIGRRLLSIIDEVDMRLTRLRCLGFNHRSQPESMRRQRG